VHGIKRRSSLFNTDRIDHIYRDPHDENRRFILHYGDLTDSSNLTRIIQEVQPDEIYNLAAQSHVAVSFESPEYTGQVDALGTLRLLEAIRLLGAKAVLPCHYNTWPPIEQDAQAWAESVRREGLAEPLVLEPGGSFKLG